MARDIVQGHGELAAHSLEHAFVAFLPEVRDDLGVAVGVQNMASRNELGALLGEIEELAIEDGVGALVFIAHGLLTIGEADNAETAGSE